MKGSRFSEEQIIGILREAGSWAENRRSMSAARDRRSDALQVESEVRREGSVRRASGLKVWKMRIADSRSCWPSRCWITPRSRTCWEKTAEACGAAHGSSPADRASRAKPAARVQAGGDRSFDLALSVQATRRQPAARAPAQSWPSSGGASAIADWVGYLLARDMR